MTCSEHRSTASSRPPVRSIPLAGKMRVAFLCKRRYTGRDVIADRFGRLHEIPSQLINLGHDVRGYCLDYHGKVGVEHGVVLRTGELPWESHSLGLLRVPALTAYPLRLLRRLRLFSPDILIGASDIPHVVLTTWLARRLGVPCSIDLYDNFESFGQARIPGFVRALSWASRSADLVVTVSEPLQQKVLAEYGPSGPVLVMPNGIDRSVFKSEDRGAARRELGVPECARLIGTAGHLSRAKGLAALYAAWPRIAQSVPDAHLVLAGPVDIGLPVPSGPRIHYLGDVPQRRVARLFNALDVGVVTVKDSAFGRYCFPQKAYEMLACGLPVVATDVGVMSSVLAGIEHSLYTPDDAASLADSVIYRLGNPTDFPVLVPEWSELVSGIEPELVRLVHS